MCASAFLMAKRRRLSRVNHLPMKETTLRGPMDNMHRSSLRNSATRCSRGLPSLKVALMETWE